MKSFVVGFTAFLLFSSCFIEKPIAPKPIPVNINLNNKHKQLTGFQYEFLDQINQLRAKGCNCGDNYMRPAPPLEWNAQLELAALGHAQDMNRKSYFDHNSKNGATLKDRVFATGYTYNGYQSFFIGENIAWGQRSIREVMDGWIASKKHCENLMNPDFKEVGIAVSNAYWVQDFGARNPFTSKSHK